MTGNCWRDVEGEEAREVWFNGGYQSCPVYNRDGLELGFQISGPAVIEEPGATTVVPPDAEVWVDETGTLHIRSED